MLFFCYCIYCCEFPQSIIIFYVKQGNCWPLVLMVWCQLMFQATFPVQVGSLRQYEEANQFDSMSCFSGGELILWKLHTGEAGQTWKVLKTLSYDHLLQYNVVLLSSRNLLMSNVRSCQSSLAFSSRKLSVNDLRKRKSLKLTNVIEEGLTVSVRVNYWCHFVLFQIGFSLKMSENVSISVSLSSGVSCRVRISPSIFDLGSCRVLMSCRELPVLCRLFRIYIMVTTIILLS